MQGKSCDQQGFGAVEHDGTLKARTTTFNLLYRATGKEVVRASDSKVTTGPNNIYLTSIEYSREGQNKYQNYNGENNSWAEIYKAQVSCPHGKR